MPKVRNLQYYRRSDTAAFGRLTAAGVWVDETMLALERVNKIHSRKKSLKVIEHCLKNYGKSSKCAMLNKNP